MSSKSSVLNASSSSPDLPFPTSAFLCSSVPAPPLPLDKSSLLSNSFPILLLMAISTLKPCRRLLIACTRSTGFFPKCPHCHRRPSAADLRSVLRLADPDPTRSGPCAPPAHRGTRGIPSAISDLRRLSSSVDQVPDGGNEAFDKFYIQGTAVKPLVVESVEAEALKEAVKEEVEQEQATMVERDEKEGLFCGGVGSLEESRGNLEVEKRREVSELEKEAWRLLNKAVVSYCGSPVGTVAANEPTTLNQLNYDQVFIRDFVPSAIAFLVKGESEIVRNFLLHTLQLQAPFCLSQLFLVLVI